MVVKTDQEQRSFALEGDLDSMEAQELTEAALAQEGTAVVIDLRGSRVVHDKALAKVVAELTAAGRRVELKGVSEHQRRLLGYLVPGFHAPGKPEPMD
ncbi:MAG: hypothetical protein U0229_19570 [Anaeromyxobacter sp.]